MAKLIKSYIATVLFLLLILSLWEAGVRLFHVPFYILPAPSRILFVFFTRLPLLFSHGAVTLLEIGLGMFLGVTGGITLALIIFYSRFLESALYPLIITSQMIPIFAIAPLLVIWFGYGLWSKATVAALIVFFPIVVNTVDGLRSVNSETIDLLHSLKANEWQILRYVRVPASLPSIFSGLKLGVTLSVVGATIGEWIGATKGLGFLMIQSNAMLRIDLVFASILMLSLVGLLLFATVRIIELRLLQWRRPRTKLRTSGGNQ